MSDCVRVLWEKCAVLTTALSGVRGLPHLTNKSCHELCLFTTIFNGFLCQLSLRSGKKTASLSISFSFICITTSPNSLSGQYSTRLLLTLCCKNICFGRKKVDVVRNHISGFSIESQRINMSPTTYTCRWNENFTIMR